VYDNAVACWNGETMSYYKNQLVKSAHKFDFPIHKPIAQLTKAQYNLLWTGNEHFEGITAFFKMLEKESYKIQYRVMLARYRGKTLALIVMAHVYVKMLTTLKLATWVFLN
jgi:excinuclease ABC subunit A